MRQIHGRRRRRRRSDGVDSGRRQLRRPCVLAADPRRLLQVRDRHREDFDDEERQDLRHGSTRTQRVHVAIERRRGSLYHQRQRRHRERILLPASVRRYVTRCRAALSTHCCKLPLHGLAADLLNGLQRCSNAAVYTQGQYCAGRTPPP